MSQAQHPVLKVTNLKKAYGAIQAVGGVSFEVRPGEIFGVIGPNGSGKTTLFNSMLGQIVPDSGRILFKGRDVSGLGPLALNRLGIGRTFQTLQVFGKMSVRDNLIVAAQEHHGSMFSRMFAPSDSGLGARADALIDQFHISHVANKKAGELSYGQQKLVAIAMAFMSEPDLVLLDEPCAGVNPSLVGSISTLLKQLNQSQRGSFVVIEHNMDFVMDLCHRIMVMVEGRVMAIGTPGGDNQDQWILQFFLRHADHGLNLQAAIEIVERVEECRKYDHFLRRMGRKELVQRRQECLELGVMALEEVARREAGEGERNGGFDGDGEDEEMDI